MKCFYTILSFILKSLFALLPKSWVFRQLFCNLFQRFLDVDKQHAFECMWCHNVSNGREYVPFELPHPNNDMTLFLELNTIESGFRLCTKDPNDDSSSLYLALSSEDVSIASAEPAEPVETYQEWTYFIIFIWQCSKLDTVTVLWKFVKCWIFSRHFLWNK